MTDPDARNFRRLAQHLTDCGVTVLLEYLSDGEWRLECVEGDRSVQRRYEGKERGPEAYAALCAMAVELGFDIDH